MSRIINIRYELLNYADLKKGELDVLSGSVALNSLAQIKRTAQFKIKEKNLKDVNYLTDRIRPVLIIDKKEIPLGIYLIPSPTREKTSEGIIRNIEAYDVTQILLEDKLTDRYFIKKGSNYIKSIVQIINSAGVFRVAIEPEEFVLKRDREFEPGESKLSVANTLLQECNYTSLYTDNSGMLIAKKYVLPSMRKTEFVYGDSGTNIEQLKVENSTEDQLDIFNVPNIFVVVASNAENKSLKSVYKNYSPTSPTSIQNRKRNIVEYKTVSDIADQQTLNNYTKRLAYNATNQYKKIKFETIVNPKHGYSNCIYVKDKKLGINDKYIETAWSFELKAGATMKHNCRRVIQI